MFQEIRIKSHLPFLHHKKMTSPLLLTTSYNRHLWYLRFSLFSKELHTFQLHQQIIGISVIWEIITQQQPSLGTAAISSCKTMEPSVLVRVCFYV